MRSGSLKNVLQLCVLHGGVLSGCSFQLVESGDGLFKTSILKLNVTVEVELNCVTWGKELVESLGLTCF